MTTITHTGAMVLIGLLVLPSTTFQAQSTNHFATLKAPVGPGDREATVTVRLQGERRENVAVYVYYSDNRAAVDNHTNNTPHGRASCKTASTGNLSCSFIFPHDDHRTPNILFRSELDGGEPPADRPTLDMFNAAQVSAATRRLFEKTDRNARRYGPGRDVYYKWVKKVTRGNREETFEGDVEQFSMPRAFTVANAGDSYASGEGAPNRPLIRTFETVNGMRDNGRRNEFANVPMWDDVTCHRSGASGQMLAIKKLVRSHPESAIRYVNVACSGATIGEGLLAAQQYVAPVPKAFWDPGNRHQPDRAIKTPQIQAIASWLRANDLEQLDAVVLSIGGNDIGFGTVGGDCMMDIIGDCRDNRTLQNFLRASLRALPASYDNLDTALRQQLGDVRVFLLEYPDPTRDAEGILCHPETNGPNPFDCWGALERSMEQRDFAFIFEDMVVPLNETMETVAGRHGWTYLGGTMQTSRTHGLCNCAAPYFHTPGQSDGLQGDHFGSIHPNNEGHEAIYKPIVYNALTRFVVEQKRQARRDAVARRNAEAKARAKAKVKAREKAPGKSGRQ